MSRLDSEKKLSSINEIFYKSILAIADSRATLYVTVVISSLDGIQKRENERLIFK